MENEESKPVTLDDLATMVAKGFADVEQRIDGSVGELRTELNARFTNLEQRVDNVDRGLTGLGYKVDQLDAKVDQHRQENKDGFDAMRRIVGGMSRTLADHEERIKMLEGE